LQPISLPVDAVIPQIVDSLRANPNLVVEAPPGAGKTTRVPPALLTFGDVVVLEPRRLATRMAARRVAQEMGEPVGETVGYQVRFEEVTSPRTRLRFLTEGVLTRRLLSDPDLKGVATVVLDEFHERHLDADLALALLRPLQRRRDLRLVVMSATLDGSALSKYLDNCPVVRSEGRLHPIDIAYTPQSSAPLEDQVATAIDRLGKLTGDVLVFLPGAAEIRRAMRVCERKNALVLSLHGDLSPEEQDRAVTPAPNGQRKIILSTNVAESSVTIEGVTAVIDSGLARIAKDSPWTGIPSLEVTRIGKNSATQRAGRAGRTAPGRVIRLYSQEDFVRRPDADTAEIHRRELSGLMLDLESMKLPVSAVPWFEPPPPAALDGARKMLERLGAFERVRELSRLPVHPRIATLVLEGGREACTIAAAISNGERAASADVFDLRADLPQTRRLADQLRRLAPAKPRLDIHHAILRAFPDRVARTRDRRVLLPEAAHTLAQSQFFVAIDIEDRRERGLPLVRLAAAIEPEWLIDLFPEQIVERSGVEWNKTAERVESSSALLYDNLIIEESRSGAVDAHQAAELLATKVREAGIERFTDPEALETLLARVEFAARHAPSLPQLDLEHALVLVCEGLRSFADLKQANFTSALMAQLSAEQRRVLDLVAPDKWKLPSGRTARVNYSRDKDPWLASRLQDFFGMNESPRVAGGKVAVVLHLLAPNQRPVQTTTDLAGFWMKWYPQIRKELMRRYPKHKWPEDPT
jgi:ATP-dependent helicase HrpB